MKQTLYLFLIIFFWLFLLESSQLAGSLDTVDLNDDYSHVIYVDPMNPNSTNDSSCYLSSEQHPCGDINVALAFPLKTSSTKFVLSSTTTHYLANHSSTTVFIDGSQVAFYGNRDNGTAVVKCTEGAGLAFLNSSDITIHRVSFQHCGAWRDSTSVDFSTNTFKLKQIRVGLYFYNCRDVTMVSMSVLNSTEALGVVMYSTVGVNTITNSQFNGNRISESNMEDSGGGGFAVEFNYCKPGDSNCSDQNHQTEGNSNATYIFEDCFFNWNRGIYRSGRNITGEPILQSNETHSSLGRGGGLSLYFKGTAVNNAITVTNCTFQSNHANWGGGLFIKYADRSIQNLVYVLNSTFMDNHCHREAGVSGGGAFVAAPVQYSSIRDAALERNLVSFDGCFFQHNRALTGGAISFIFNFQRWSLHSQIFQANLTLCMFESNYARLGSAVSVDREYFYLSGEIGQMFLESCSFSNNAVVYTDPSKPYSVGIGALYVSEVQVTFQGHNRFEQNNGSALAIVGTRIILSQGTSMIFTENTGSNGAAISLLGVSSLVIGRDTELLFKNNAASLFGGAIHNNYIGKEDLHSSEKCFLQYSDPNLGPREWQTKFTFSGNTAGKLGDSIFSTTILPCSWSEDLLADLDIVNDIFCWNKSAWIYENSTCADQIFSNPQSFDTSNHTRVIFPGYPFHLNIKALDDLNHDVTKETVYTADTGNTSTAEVSPEYVFIADNYLDITGKEEQDVTLELDVAGSRDWHFELPITLERCPPGFIGQVPANNEATIPSTGDRFNRNTTSRTACECIGGDNPYSYQGNLICDKISLLSKIRNGYWIGLIPNIRKDTLFMAQTAITHQNTVEGFFPLTQNYDDLNSIQCSQLNRRGPLCGECIDGYSTAVNSYNFTCVPCTSNTTNIALNIFAYVSLTYVPYLVVFLLIIMFDVRLVSGPVVGFVLYAQLFGAGVFDLKHTVEQLGETARLQQRAYRIVYGAFNLNSFSWILDPFCVNENFSALDVICLDFAIAVFPLFLLMTISLLMRLNSIRLSFRDRSISTSDLTPTPPKVVQKLRLKMNRTTLIHSFVAVIYLSYSKLCLTSTSLLTTAGIIEHDGSGLNVRLIYYAGQYYFGQREYIWPYGLIAVFVFIFFAALLPVLLLGPLQFVNWLADKPRFQFINRCWPTLRLNIFLDAFQCCYKLSHRYFAGIYLLFRLLMFIVYAFSFNEIAKILWQQLLCIFMIVLVGFFKPYKVRFFNYLDMLLFVNIAAINSISIYIFTTSFQNIQSYFPLSMYIVGSLLSWLPLVYLFLYICWWVVQKTRFYPRILGNLHPWIRYLFSMESLREQHPLANVNQATRGRLKAASENMLTDSKLFRRAEATNRYQAPPKTSIQKDRGELGVPEVNLDLLRSQDAEV